MYLMDLDKQGVAALMTEWRQPRFRTDQVMAWLNKGARPEEMTNLPKALREQLAALPYGGSVIERKLTSPKDGTVKYLFLLEDGNLVEGVLMHYSYGNTACISTQVGCRMGCKFCASTLEGCVRDLRPGEMLSFIKLMEQDEPPREGWSRSVTNIVLMGSGEPLDNYDNVVTFLRRVTSPDELNISPRNISLSTCGLVPKIYRFMEEAPHVTLSISLHAHSDEVRRTMMPIANTYPIGDLIEAARAYAEKTGRRVVFEYPGGGGERRPGGRRGPRKAPSGHGLPREPDPAEQREGAVTDGREPGPRGGVRRVAHEGAYLRHRAAGDGRRYRRRLRTVEKEGDP